MVRILIDLARSPRLTLSREDALRLLSELASTRATRDLEEAIRIVRSFDEYLRYSRRRFEEYINVPKDPGDALRGMVVVHRLRLFTEGDRGMVEIVFDRRVRVDDLVSALKRIGFDEVHVEEQGF